MSKVTRTIVLDDIKAAELARMFCDMYGDEQAKFFDEIKPISDTWRGAGWCSQAADIASHVTPAGREVITKLAEHVLGYDDLIETVHSLRDLALHCAELDHPLIIAADRVLAKATGAA